MNGPFFRARELTNGTIPKIDAHVHTSLTDGNSSLEDYVMRARELGLSAIAFSEHMDNSSDWFDEYMNSKERLRELAGPVRVYFGAEVKLAHSDGTLNLGLERMRELDFVMGVLHRYPDACGGYLSFKDIDSQEALELDYRLSKALISNPLVDVFGHPGGVYAHYFGHYDVGRMRELVSLAVARGIVIDINSSPRYRHVFKVILETCLELDCVISIGSDAHHVDDLGQVIHHLQRSVNYIPMSQTKNQQGNP